MKWKRLTPWSLVLLLLVSGAGFAASSDPADEFRVPLVAAAQAEESVPLTADGALVDTAASAELDPFWLAVKNGQQGNSSYVPQPGQLNGQYHSSLINSYDPTLIEHRATWLPLVLTAALFGMIVIFALFVLVNGPSKLSHGFSGREVYRWSKLDIIAHWVMAIPCLLLIVTGLALMAGRFVFSSFLGAEGVGALAAVAKPVHDIMVWPFIISAIYCMLAWMKDQFPAMYDVKWFLMVGGYLNFGPFKGKHPDAGFANAGEKLWFWCFTLFGLLIIGSGALLMWPQWFEPSRTTALLALLVHGGSAVIMTAFTVVHIFMATVMSEGGMPAMVSGYVDENWAKQHHNVWYDEIKANGSLRYRDG